MSCGRIGLRQLRPQVRLNGGISLHGAIKKIIAVMIIFLLCLNTVYCTGIMNAYQKVDDSGTPLTEAVPVPTESPAASPTPVQMPPPMPSPEPEPSPTVTPTPIPEQGSGPEVMPTPSPEAAPSTDETVTEPAKQNEDAQAEAKKQEELKKAAAQKFNQDMGRIVKKYTDSYYKNGGKGVVGIYIKELGTGFDYGYNDTKTNEDRPEEGYFNTASTCKLFAAAVVYYLDYTDGLEVDKTFKDSVTGWKYNLKKIMYKMVTHSVNDYFNITLRQLGGKRINEVISQLGTANSYVYSEIMPAVGTTISSNNKRYGISRSPRTTPRDLAHILELLYEGDTFGKENNVLFTESLKHNIYSNRLPQGIGYRSPVGHKTGTSSTEGVYNDAGIIYLKGNPYIMVVMSKGSSSSVQTLYHKICKDVYDYMAKRVQSK